MNEAEVARRKSFGRGIFEGLRMAGIDEPGAFMNAAKQARLMGGLNGVAIKVLEAVPIQEIWTKDQIAQELRRQGLGSDRRVIDGCLDSLRGRGLIREPERGRFTRVEMRTSMAVAFEEAQPEEKKESPPMESNIHKLPAAQQQPGPGAALDSLSRLANIAALLRTAADEADSIALEFTERLQAIEKDTADLRQLRALLLKSMGQ